MDKTRQYPKVAIVVVTYNNKNIIDENLQSIQNLLYSNYDCILVDDCSNDGTCEYVTSKYPWVKVISKKENTGPAVSRNIAIKASDSKYIAFLDSDVVLDKQWLSECVRVMEQDKQIGICGSKLLDAYNPNILNEAGGILLKIGLGMDRGVGESISKFDKKERLFFIGSAAIVTRRDVLAIIENFDESYYFGYQDVDLCWRTNLIGYKVVYNPDALAYHKCHATVKKMGCKIFHHNLRNSIKTMIKNYEVQNLVIYIPLAFLVSLSDIIILNECRKAKIGAWLWNIKNIKETLKTRRSIQKIRIVRDSQIMEYFENNSYLFTMIKNRMRRKYKKKPIESGIL